MTRQTKNDNRALKIMIAPALILLLGALIPFGKGVWTSLTNSKLYSSQSNTFIWFENYRAMFTNSIFLQGLKTLVIFVVSVLVIQFILGIMIAHLLNTKTRFTKISRSILVIPLLIPPVVASLLWKTLMWPTDGVLNWILDLVNLGPYQWLTSPTTALFSTIIIDTWIYLPFVTIILLSGLQSVSQDQIEAAKLDGANSWQIFKYVSLPWLVPYIFLAGLFRGADAIKTFDVIYSTTRGGPIDSTRVLHIQAYEEGFRWANAGSAMAIVLFLWFMVYLFSNTLIRFSKLRDSRGLIS